VRRVGDTRDIPVDVRIIAATNQDLLGLARDGTFREDLYFRLNVIPIHVPPLRERPEDIPELVRYFLERYGGPGTEISPEALEAILACPWPGNVRELENVLERVVAMHPGEAIQREFLPGSVLGGEARPAPAGGTAPPIPAEGIRLEEAVDAFERDLIVRALEATGGKRPEAARLLGLTLRSLRYRLDKHGL
jgi:two-component system response regulator PilR (NtrC family)